MKQLTEENLNQRILGLLQRQYDAMTFLSHEQKLAIFRYFQHNQAYVQTLYYLYESLITDQAEWKNEQGLSVHKQGEMYCLHVNTSELMLNKQQLVQIIRDTTGILERLLPIGSVVDLKKEYLAKIMNEKDVAYARFVITKRYATVKDQNLYFPYTGVVYPLGDIDGQAQLNFTPQLIERVVHEGYEDIQETAYQLLMKEETIVQKQLRSAAFLEGGN